MYQKIFATLDRSDRARPVFETALSLAEKYGGSLMIFHAVEWDFGEHLGSFAELEAEVDLSGAFSQERQEKLAAELDAARQWLQQLSQEARDRGVETTVKTSAGHVGPIACQLARKWEADAIVTGRRGREAWVEALLGSVSSYIVHHAHCLVTIVQD